MFPESSTWQADVVRVTADGRADRRSASRGTATGGRSSCPTRGLRTPASATTPTPGSTTSSPSSTRPSTGSPTTRRATPRPATSRRSSRRGTTPTEPQVVVLRSDDRGDPVTPARHRPPGAASTGSTSCSGGRVSMRALALLRILRRAGRAAAPVAVPRRRARRDDLPRHVLRALRVRGTRSCPAPLYVAVLWIGAVAAVAMTIGLSARLATVTTFAVVAYNLFLSTTHFHNNRAYLVIVLAALAVAPCGRELSVDAWWRGPTGVARRSTRRRRPGRCGCCASRPSTVYGASGLSKLARPGLVRRHGDVAPGRAGARPAGGLARCRAGPSRC